MITIAELGVADPPEAWQAAGFDVAGDELRIGRVGVRLTGLDAHRRGVVEWHLRGAAKVPPGGTIDGLATIASDAPVPEPAGHHPNGANLIDHVVVATPDYARTIAALRDAGFELRRERDTGTRTAPIRQGFFRAGEVIVEVVGPTSAPAGGTGAPARFFGLAIVVDDLDATKARFGEHCTDPKPAVQPGRRIATLQHRALGLTTAIAFMTA